MAERIDPNMFRGACGQLVPSFPSSGSGVGIEILQQLRGQPWDDLALCLVSMFRPRRIRVTTGEVTTESPIGSRVTVFVTPDSRILRIELEDSVGLQDGMRCGGDLYAACRARNITLTPSDTEPASLSPPFVIASFANGSFEQVHTFATHEEMQAYCDGASYGAGKFGGDGFGLYDEQELLDPMEQPSDAEPEEIERALAAIRAA